MTREAEMERVLRKVLRTIEARASDHWWIDVPENGGFDTDEIEKVLGTPIEECR